ncbi:hypothetical protein JRO89_XS09G0002200 [Xanthoceras sorbifolium]|uniref:Uncharacterized protein n=1 Tax=Xanthoceras sorbifolium TaxID=99658 RepID=A0ABQ8HK57_9ROSI|nr:hypothetical protein JRO89_XS09G0002200 [Xanthoceras sorbifolium]
MGSPEGEIELQEQLREAGNLLLSPPSDIHQLNVLLDKVESLLANVEQAPSDSVRGALLPSMKALIANEVLRHPDASVRTSVASCMSEITRISAPDAPYNDDEMREIFQLIVSAFEKLADMSGRLYTKAVNSLDIVAKVRTCLVMLDLECDASIMEMFKTFLKVISSDHPNTIFSAMERTMTLVIDESEEVSWDLLSTLLDSVRKENQDISSTSWKLGEQVITNCAAKLKPYLMEAVQSKGVVLEGYADIVSTICKSGDGTLQHNHLNGTGEHMVTEEPDSTSPGEVCHDVDGISKSMMHKGTAPTRNEDSFINDKSSKVLEQCSLSEHPKSTDEREQPISTDEREQHKSTDEREPPKTTDEGEHPKSTDEEEHAKSTDEEEHPKSTDEEEHPNSTDEQEHPKNMDVRGCAEPDNTRTVKSGSEQESVPRKRGRKPNSLMNPEEGY